MELAAISSQGDFSPVTVTVSATSTGEKLKPSNLSPSIRSEQTADTPNNLQRPKARSRKRSDTIIVSRDSPYFEIHEEYDEDDARTMSPRRGSEEIEIMCEQARKALDMQKKALRKRLLEIGGCVESIKIEQNKLEDGNRSLQSYVGELIQKST
ncbi:hypothetical protein K469DRAFT_676400 [Zopfia rhizophila CBS 207.26]|uniref:Uncharacterized protein n=1 Tax=Zopfia rhizophila CBS 207.26 TaxID=1314779 RepID=A0A6A6DKH7_9PEZI|nr:hypothetical protein K469DRAFT_676400 [Zopfia rhizophila CBS 207.26]